MSQTLKLFLAADHAGFDLKEAIKAHFVAAGYEVEDCGAFAKEPTDDYPDFVAKAAEHVAEAPAHHRAFLFGYSGQGEAMVANRFSGVRAAVYTGGGEDVVRLSREHNDANVLSFGAHFVSTDEAIHLTDLWLTTPFSHEDRHVRRIKKIDESTHRGLSSRY